MFSFAKFRKCCDCCRDSFGLLSETVKTNVNTLIHLRLYTCEDIQIMFFKDNEFLRKSHLLCF